MELANQGTLFLDEIGEIPQALQSKLLTVLQEKELERLGSGLTFVWTFACCPQPAETCEKWWSAENVAPICITGSMYFPLNCRRFVTALKIFLFWPGTLLKSMRYE